MVDFDELSFLEFNGVSVLKYVNTSKYSAIFHSGISVTVEGQTELLGLVTLVPTMFKGTILGFLALSKRTSSHSVKTNKPKIKKIICLYRFLSWEKLNNFLFCFCTFYKEKVSE